MRTSQIGLLRGVDCLDQLRLRWVVRHVDDEDAAGKEAAAPDVRAVIGVAEVMRLVAGGAEVELLQDLAVAVRFEIDVDGEQEVVVLAVGIDAENVEILLGAVQALDERRQARLSWSGDGQQQKGTGGAAERESFHGSVPVEERCALRV